MEHELSSRLDPWLLPRLRLPWLSLSIEGDRTTTLPVEVAVEVEPCEATTSSSSSSLSTSCRCSPFRPTVLFFFLAPPSRILPSTSMASAGATPSSSTAMAVSSTSSATTGFPDACGEVEDSAGERPNWRLPLTRVGAGAGADEASTALVAGEDVVRLPVEEGPTSFRGTEHKRPDTTRLAIVPCRRKWLWHALQARRRSPFLPAGILLHSGVSVALQNSHIRPSSRLLGALELATRLLLFVRRPVAEDPE